MLVFRAVPISGQQLGSADRSALADTVSSIINVGEPFKLAHCLAVILPAVELPAMPLHLSTAAILAHSLSPGALRAAALSICCHRIKTQTVCNLHLPPTLEPPTLPAADPAAVQAMATNSTLPTSAAGRHLLQQSPSAASDIAIMVDLPPGVSVANAISLLQQASGTGEGTLQQQALAK